MLSGVRSSHESYAWQTSSLEYVHYESLERPWEHTCRVDDTLEPMSLKNSGSVNDTPDGRSELTSKSGSWKLPLRSACVTSTWYSWLYSSASSSQSCVALKAPACSGDCQC